MFILTLNPLMHHVTSSLISGFTRHDFSPDLAVFGGFWRKRPKLGQIGVRSYELFSRHSCVSAVRPSVAVQSCSIQTTSTVRVQITGQKFRLKQLSSPDESQAPSELSKKRFTSEAEN